MNLQTLAYLSQIGSAIATVAIAVLVYLWQRRSTKAQWGAIFTEQMRHYNLLVLENVDLQQFEKERHPYGRPGELALDEVAKMYRFFILLNVAHSMYIASRAGAVDPSSYEALFKNSANMLYNDRQFIATHCFPRGYPLPFRDQLARHWKAREENGGIPVS